MPNLENRLARLEAATTAEVGRIIIYKDGEEPEIPTGDGVFFLLPDNHREDNHHAQP